MMRRGYFMDYKRNMRYFRRFNFKIPVIISVSGAMLFILGSEGGTTALGSLLLVGGVLMWIAFYNLTPTDEEIDRVTFEYLKDIKKKSIDKLEDSYSEFETQDPIVISNYYFKQSRGNAHSPVWVRMESIDHPCTAVRYSYSQIIR